MAKASKSEPARPHSRSVRGRHRSGAERRGTQHTITVDRQMHLARAPIIALVSAVLGTQRGSAQNVDVDWVISPAPPPETATVGGTATFTWSGYHNVYVHPSGTCDDANAVLVGSSSPAVYTFTSDDVGDVVFACDVGSHCESGQIVTFTVSAGSADCTGTANGNAVEDACGVCEGDSSSCADCAGTANGNAVEDACGVCDGHNWVVGCPDTDCAGSWSDCTTACEAAADRTWSQLEWQSGNGAACPLATSCGNGDDGCVTAYFVNPAPTTAGTVTAELTVNAELTTILQNQASFKAGFATDVSTILGCSASQVVVPDYAAGSVIVSFAVTPAADGTAVTASALTSAFSGVVSLPTAGVSTTAALSTPVVVAAVTSAPTASPVTSAPTASPTSPPASSGAMTMDSVLAATTGMTLTLAVLAH